MNRTRITFYCCLFLCTMLLPLRAQTVRQVDESFAEFNSSRASGASEADIYAALYRCYTECVKAIEAAAPESPDEAQVKRRLREILPFLRMGAAWNSNHGNAQNALCFAQAYMDVPMMEAFRNETFMRDANYATMAYFAASGTYNAGDYSRAIRYFRAYLDSGDQKNRQSVYAFMAKACLNIQRVDMAMEVLEEASNSYPSDFTMLSMAINACIDSGDNVSLQRFVTRALAVRPDDETLVNIQGKLYEDTQDFQKALNLYTKLQASRPNSLNVMKHVALNYYNLGVTHYNKAMLDETESTARRNLQQSKDFFAAAAGTMEQVVANDPAAVKYLQAMAVAYQYSDDENHLAVANDKLAMLGYQTVDRQTIPTLMKYGDSGEATDVTQPMQNIQPVAASQRKGGEAFGLSTPPVYSQYAKEYVEKRIGKWQQKDDYETIDEYQARVSVSKREQKVKELLVEAEREYLRLYTKHPHFNDMVLKPYDAENGVFLVQSQYGELIVPVPRENNEARMFESSWSGMKFQNPQFYVSNDKILLSALTFVTPTGHSYQFDGKKELNYTETVVNIDFTPIDTHLLADHRQQNKVTKKTVSLGGVQSDVDKDIPVSGVDNDRTFAVIIANENYSMVTPVPMALHDGDIFREYCVKTLGIPERNVRIYPDASYGVMIRAIRDVKGLAEAFAGQLNVIFYYAGHGIPNEATKDAFLLPVDADGMQTEGCYPLSRLYSELGGLNARTVVAFLDACFSGAKRDGGMLASARGVALKAKRESPKGNMVIFSAASDDETAFPYEEKGHGLFTYFLLKKLQESKGDVTLQELGNYIIREVKQQSILVNRKPQTPSVTPAVALESEWQRLKLIP